MISKNTSSYKIDELKILLVLGLATFIVPFMGSALNLALPEISRTFSMSAVTLTWFNNIYIISTAIFQMPAARISDIFGRRKIFALGVVFLTVPTFLTGIAPNIEILFILRFLAGLGSAMTNSTITAIITSIFQPPKRGKIIAIITAVVYASLAIGPFFGGLLTHYLGWQSIFFSCSLIGVVILILIPFSLKEEWIEAKNTSFDVVGSVIYGVALFTTIYGFTNLSNLSGILWLASGIIAFVIFILYERKIENPLIYLKLFVTNRVFAFSSLASLINYAATFAIIFMLSLYLQYIRGLDPKTAGLMLIPQAVVQTIVSILVGQISEKKIHPSNIATFGMIVVVFGLFGLIFISPDTSFYFIIFLFILLGIGFGCFSAPNTNVIMSSVDKKYYGFASGTAGTVRLVGQSLSMGIAGMVISFQMGTNKLVPEYFPDFMYSMRIVFIIFLVLCIIGVFASNARNTKNETKKETSF